jgi:hypothetical protein
MNRRNAFGMDMPFQREDVPPKGNTLSKEHVLSKGKFPFERDSPSEGKILSKGDWPGGFLLNRNMAENA